MEADGESSPMKTLQQSSLPATTKESTRSGLTHSLTIKLDENNFLLWSQQVNGVITAHNLHRFVVNPQIPLQFDSIEDRANLKNSVEYQKWLVKDQTLFTWLLSTISDGILPRVLSCRHAHEVWDSIHKYFNSMLKSRARQLRFELKNTKKMSCSVNEYLLRIKSIVNSPVAVGDIVTKQEQIDAILEGLPEEFNSFVMMVYSRFDTPTVEDIEALLLLQEVQFEKFKQELSNLVYLLMLPTPQRMLVIPALKLRAKLLAWSTTMRRRHGDVVMAKDVVEEVVANTKALSKVRLPVKSVPCPMLSMPYAFHAMSDVESSTSGAWYPDSGASHHLTYNPNNLSYRVPYNGYDQVLMGIGQVSKFAQDNNVIFEFHPYHCFVKSQGSNQILLEGSVGVDGLYKFQPFKFLPINGVNSKLTQASSSSNSVTCTSTTSAVHHDPANSLESHRLYAPSSTTVYIKPFEVIHCDLWGPSPVISYYGYSYYITFVDTFTKFTWIYFLKTKGDALKAFSQFLALVQNQFQTSIKALQSDWGGEFRPFTALLNELGIHHRLTCPHTSHQNGTVERKHRHIVETGLTLLSHASLPLKFWDHSFTQSVHLINKLPSSALSNFQSPHQALYNTCPDYTQLKSFGCLCFPHLRPYNKHKLQYRSSPYVYLGISPQHKGHKCLDASGRIYISKDVIFHESKYPYQSMFSSSSQTPSNTSSYPAHILFPAHNDNTLPSTPTEVSQQSVLPPSPQQQSPSDPVTQHTPIFLPSSSSTPLSVDQINSIISQPVSSASPSLASPLNPFAIPPVLSNHNNHSMITRGKTGSLKPKIFLAELEPKTVRCALNDPKWNKAMQAEYQALMDNKTWTLVPLPLDRKAIGCKWIFRVKENPDGTVNKYKARLVVKGFLQTAGFDFIETFSPVIKPVTIRIILTLAVTFKWQIQQIDVNNAFLNGVLQEEVYMTQPSGFESSDKSLVCKLHKSLYGLKQAPRAWYDKLTQALLHMGFVKSRCDPSLLVHNQNGTCTYVLIYMDDILITGSTPTLINDLINKLNVQFALKRLGAVDYFLGLEVHHLPSGALLLNQTKYIRDLLCKAHMEDSKHVGSPMVSSCRLSKFGTDTMTDPTLYRSIVGALQYATLTRPDIVFSVNKVCQFMAKPLDSHWLEVKRILRYLKGTLSHGILINPSTTSPPFSLRAYSDADWATDQDDRRSTSGSCIYFGPKEATIGGSVEY
ncbi:hypothetical protein TSUD_395330 [Trifolium subterraneum]|uniref:Integrase catalytic domain-containing protein n=1 Tax=Trifolium subterraneum TaxID=3900 RepID=A0A2Z6N0R7_TRISU|nr:hypothetical protein TSUD_395330 [Trifolium subterraneum]